MFLKNIVDKKKDRASVADNNPSSIPSNDGEEAGGNLCLTA